MTFRGPHFKSCKWKHRLLVCFIFSDLKSPVKLQDHIHSQSFRWFVVHGLKWMSMNVSKSLCLAFWMCVCLHGESVRWCSLWDGGHHLPFNLLCRNVSARKIESRLGLVLLLFYSFFINFPSFLQPCRIPWYYTNNSYLTFFLCKVFPASFLLNKSSARVLFVFTLFSFVTEFSFQKDLSVYFSRILFTFFSFVSLPAKPSKTFGLITQVKLFVSSKKVPSQCLLF